MTDEMRACPRKAAGDFPRQFQRLAFDHLGPSRAARAHALTCLRASAFDFPHLGEIGKTPLGNSDARTDLAAAPVVSRQETAPFRIPSAINNMHVTLAVDHIAERGVCHERGRSTEGHRIFFRREGR